MFSVDTEEEAVELLTLTTSRGPNGEFIVRELALKQSLERLYGFGLKLQIVYDSIREFKSVEAKKGVEAKKVRVRSRKKAKK